MLTIAGGVVLGGVVLLVIVYLLALAAHDRGAALIALVCFALFGLVAWGAVVLVRAAFGW